MTTTTNNHTGNGETLNIFARPENDNLFAILDAETGEAVTYLDGCWPLDRDGETTNRNGQYEHPEGIYLSREQVEELGIEIES